MNKEKITQENETQEKKEQLISQEQPRAQEKPETQENPEAQEHSDAQEKHESQENSDAISYNEYTDSELSAAVEAVLFATGDSVEGSRLEKALNMVPGTLKQRMPQITENYEEDGRGIRIICLEGSYQLCTKNEYYDLISRIVNIPKRHILTDVLLETLSIVAYKQPVTKPEIEAIRGVSCAHAINKLLEYELIEEVGRLDAPGRPILFGTTEEFLRCFGVSSMDDLPVIGADKIEDFRQEAMEEAEFTLSPDTSDV